MIRPHNGGEDGQTGCDLRPRINARDLKVGTGTVQRVKREMEAAGPFDGAAAA